MNPLRILLIEDEAMIADIYERMLARLVAAFPGATVTRVESLIDAREILKGLAPDVAVLDLNLRDAGSAETILEIEAISKRCPVVVVTGIDDPSLREECLRRGAHSFIAKREMVNAKDTSILERMVTAAIEAFKINKREGLSRDIAALRKFASTHGPET